ncbi:hypothetical protein EVG20_g9914 [Dentipellis fragilis]|uniref:Uncharacterized protein n=1 Tax=Dentipellis fragilis TaxID=205917 RepID=A0A4Y9XUU0_9AGAM|nr:hypothetical protein EVG20_g9914 [Dentipellis fragilis]
MERPSALVFVRILLGIGHSVRFAGSILSRAQHQPELATRGEQRRVEQRPDIQATANRIRGFEADRELMLPLLGTSTRAPAPEPKPTPVTRQSPRPPVYVHRFARAVGAGAPGTLKQEHKHGKPRPTAARPYRRVLSDRDSMPAKLKLSGAARARARARLEPIWSRCVVGVGAFACGTPGLWGSQAANGECGDPEMKMQYSCRYSKRKVSTGAHARQTAAVSAYVHGPRTADVDVSATPISPHDWPRGSGSTRHP